MLPFHLFTASIYVPSIPFLPLYTFHHFSSYRCIPLLFSPFPRLPSLITTDGYSTFHSKQFINPATFCQCIFICTPLPLTSAYVLPASAYFTLPILTSPSTIHTPSLFPLSFHKPSLLLAALSQRYSARVKPRVASLHLTTYAHLTAHFLHLRSHFTPLLNLPPLSFTITPLSLPHPDHITLLFTSLPSSFSQWTVPVASGRTFVLVEAIHSYT